jgi:Mg/Co/Ni transporter MgtE
VQDFFDAPTIAEIAERIGRARASAQAEVQKIDDLLKLVEQLSESEIRQLLSEPGDDTKE